MDELETDLQVLFPNVFLRPVGRAGPRPRSHSSELQSLACGIWAKAKKRLRWAVMLPWSDLRGVPEGILARKMALARFSCRDEADRLPSQSLLLPHYQLAVELGHAVCVHAGHRKLDVHDLFPEDTGL